VRGNHEEWFMAWARREGFDDFALRRAMGGRATLDSYGVVGLVAREIEAEAWRVPEAHRRWVEEFGLAVDLEVQGHRYWMLHAGIPSSVAIPCMPKRNRSRPQDFGSFRSVGLSSVEARIHS